jgi:hypothetical protein
MKRNSVLLSSLFLAGLLEAAITPVQSFSFDFISGGNSFDPSEPEEPFTSFLESIPISGFNKFDPSLGTLREIRLTVQVSVSFDASIEAEEVDDTSLPFDLALDLETGIDAGVFYLPSGNNILLFPATEGYGSVNLGGAGYDPNDFIFDDQFYFFDGASDQFGPFNDVGEVTMGSLFASDPDVSLSDFVGIGPVQGLEVGVLVPLDNVWTVANIPYPFGSITVNLEAGEVTLTYVYEPGITPIPEPGHLAALLGLSAAAGLGLRRRR